MVGLLLSPSWRFRPEPLRGRIRFSPVQPVNYHVFKPFYMIACLGMRFWKNAFGKPMVC